MAHKLALLPLAALAALALLSRLSQAQQPVGYTVALAETYTAIGTSNASTLYEVSGEGIEYDAPVYLIDLHGTRFQMGYDYGFLLGPQVSTLSAIVLGNLISHDPIELDAVKEFALWQWDSYLAKHLPSEYLDELAGLSAGGLDAGYADAGAYVTIFASLANMPGTVSDIKYILEQELFGGRIGVAELSAAVRALDVLARANWQGFGCSMLGAWGSRATPAGALYSARNLDWNTNLGLGMGKLVTIFHPPGAYAHATFGFVGFFGVLAGVSAEGLSVHEANLEEGKFITFDGFPWVFRLRYIMENARNLSQALALFNATTNTVGFNFGFYSLADVVPGQYTHAGANIETNAFASAVFLDDSPIEAAAMIGNTQIGFPLAEAVWRTNAPYDPLMRADYSWSQGVTSDSQLRYMLIHDALVSYEALGVPVGLAEMINVTAIVAAKSEQEPNGNPYLCPPAGQGTPAGSNILSVVNAPALGMSYVAWENGMGAAWRAACCNTYVGLDLARFW